MKRYIVVIALCATAVWAQSTRPRALWVKYDAEAKASKLSNGEPVTNAITPGLFVGYDRQGLLRALRQWRPPQDIEQVYVPTGATRVVFSHERHFAVLGVKDCKSCHAQEKGLGTGRAFASLATDPAAEPHGEKSQGRFCANCHRSELKSSQIPGANPPLDVAMFTALGKTGDTTCGSCHAPADHGDDFTRGHGNGAGGARTRCVACHRGATGMSQADFEQAQSYQQAQLALIKNPVDKDSFRHTLPDNFCAYCHSFDQRLRPSGRGARGNN
jgi:hypothetical protein